MFTPAINASSTSAFPLVIMVNAFCTHVMSPPFLNLFPFADEITTGLADFELITVGACPKSARGVTANVNPPTTLDCMKRRLFMPHPNPGMAGEAKPCFASAQSYFALSWLAVRCLVVQPDECGLEIGVATAGY